MICPRCGRTLSDSATFCPQCGAPITAGEQSPSVAPPASEEDVASGETVVMPPDELGGSASGEGQDSGKTQYLPPDALPPDVLPPDAVGEAAGAPRSPSAGQAGDEPLRVREGNQYWSDDPGETRFMTIPVNLADDAPSRGEAFPVINEDDLNRDGLDPLYDDSYNAPAYQNLAYAETSPIAGGVPEEPRERRRRRRLRKLGSFLLLLVVLGIVGGAAWYTWDQEMWGGVRVPDVVGETETQARSDLTVKGLSATVEEVAADSDFGVVLESDPAAGERCSTSQSVVLRVAVERTIPDVIGLTQEEAQAQLEDAGVTDVAVEYTSSSAESGTVLSVSPDVGASFVSGDTVTITVAQPYTVPDVVGLTRDEAVEAIESAGLTPELNYVDGGGEAGVVLSVSPDVGTTVEHGATVTITLPIPYPTDPSQVMSYYALTSEQISTYLTSQGYSLAQGGTYTDGKGFERWNGTSGDRIYFTSQPEVYTGPSGVTDVLAAGAEWDAVRYDVSASSSTATGAVSEENARALASSCGLSGNVDRVCTQTNITTPYSVDRSAYDFVCLQGSSGDYVWVVLLYRGKGSTYTTYQETTTVVQTPNDDGTVTETTTTEQVPLTTTVPADTYTTAVVAVMRSETSKVSGLESFGGYFADYFAYVNMFAS